ncbi:MAG: hypothetical protein KF858_06050 [Candidatus Sumerlaeia bacterium]|nr:hypothetical protein [Candidatus Sumerlaeia bacterium]
MEHMDRLAHPGQRDRSAWSLSLIVLALLALLCPTLHAQPATAGARTPESWLYIEPFEVRHEVLIPFHVLESLLPIARRDAAWLDVDEQDEARDDIADFLGAMAPVEIDGIEVQPVSSRVVFFDRAVTTIVGNPPPARLPVAEVTVGLIHSFGTKGPARRVRVTWSGFGPVLETIRGTAVAGDTMRRHAMSPASPSLEWTARGEIAVPAVRRIPAEGRVVRPADAEAAEIFETLLRNIYRAFDYRAEGDIYDALARSVADDLLTRLYLDIRRGLVLEAEGGATARVESVSVSSGALATPPAEPRAFTYRATWQAAGRIEHWGHVHDRANTYTAEFTVGVRDASWKLTSMRVLRHERNETGLRVRDLTGGSGS